MKTIKSLLLILCVSISTAVFSKSIDIAANWTGTYNTTYGQIILNQKDNYVVGTYRELGTIRSAFNAGNELYVEFDNNGRKGYAKWQKTTKGFTGTWGWTNKLEQGKWEGTKVKDAEQNYIQGLWKSTYGDIEFVNSRTGMMAGHYGDKGGMIWGKMNHSTKIFEGNYKQKEGAKTETCWFYFYNEKFEGKFNDRPRGSWNGWRPEEEKLNTSSFGNATASDSNNEKLSLKVTVNSVKLYEQPRRYSNFSMNASASLLVNSHDYIPRDHHNTRSKALLHSTPIALNVVKRPNSYLIYNLGTDKRALLGNVDFKIHTEIRYDKPGIYSNYETSKVTRANNIPEILKYLTGDTNANDYPLVPNYDGRRRLPNSADTFWLEEVGGKRLVRGYGDLHFKNGDFKVGYHYTIELINN